MSKCGVNKTICGMKDGLFNPFFGINSISSSTDDWILNTGFWVDSGSWIDSDVWID